MEAIEQKAQAKLQGYIDGARERSAGALRRIMNEVPTDRIARIGALAFGALPGESVDLGVRVGGTDEPQRVHRNALDQLAGIGGIPTAYLHSLMDTRQRWATDLAVDNLRETLRHKAADNRFLVRTVGDQVRAVLSDRYRRIDCRPGLDALVQAATSRGAIVADATATDTRVNVKMIVPQVFHPFAGEAVVWGMEWSNSDYGRGAQTLRSFVMRLWCLNGATMETAMRTVHLGARLSEDVDYSRRTYDLDQRATVSALRDTANTLLADESAQRIMGLISAANDTKIDVKAALADLKKKIGKGTADQVAEAYQRPDVEDLPPGNTAWRWSNALSWVAGHTDDQENRIDLERLAGAALAKAA